jgi:DNA topoisomerase IB
VARVEDRRVRTSAGVAKYHVPEGTIIRTRSTQPNFVSRAGKPVAVNNVTVHHSSDGDGSRVTIARTGQMEHAVKHSNAADANAYLDQLLEDNPNIPHVTHNIQGRLFKESLLNPDRNGETTVHMQMPDGKMKEVGKIGFSNGGSTARRSLKHAKDTGQSPRARTYHNMKDTLQHFLHGMDDTELDDAKKKFTVDAVSAVERSIHAQHMRPIKDNETHAPDGTAIPRGTLTHIMVAKDDSYPLQVIGLQSNGKLKYGYGKSHQDSALEEKFARFSTVARNMHKLDKALAGENYDHDTAAMVHVLRHTGMRVDSEKGDKTEAAKKTIKGGVSYGAATMEWRHVRIKGNTVAFSFPGKGGKLNDYTIENDKKLADSLRKRKAKGVRPTDRVFGGTDSTKSAAYIARHLGIPTNHANHDLRTHMASSSAAAIVNEMVRRKALPQTEAEHKKAVNYIGSVVGELINDTRATALGKYIAPQVLHPLRGDLDGPPKDTRAQSRPLPRKRTR